MKDDEDVVIEFNELMGIYQFENQMTLEKALLFARPEMLKRMEQAGEKKSEAVYRFKHLINTKQLHTID